MTGSGPPELRVDADLRLDVDGVTASITGHGDDVTVFSETPGRLWAALAEAALPSGVGRVDGPRALGRLANSLDERGVRVHIDGPQGRLVTLGDPRSSFVGRVATGSGHLRLGSPRAVGPIVAARLRPRYLAAATFIGLSAVLAAWHRRRRSQVMP